MRDKYLNQLLRYALSEKEISEWYVKCLYRIATEGRDWRMNNEH